MEKKTKRKNNQSGAAMLISVIFFLCVSLAIISGLVSPAVREFKNASVNLNSKQSYFLAESGSEDAFYRILKNIPISNSAILKLNKNSVTTTVTSLSGNSKQISSLGNVSNLQRKTNVVVSTDTGVSFNYGIQVGQGGVNLIGSGKVNGNIYADGPITGDSSAIITGTAISAGSGGKIIGSSGSQYNQLHVGTVSGTAQAHTVNYTNATGNIYCTLGTGNNKSCISQADPANVDFPVSDTDIAEWEADALTGGISNGNYSVGWAGATLGPKKIVGNLTVSGGGTLTVSGTLWVTGNIYLSGGGTIQLVSGYGASDGVIIADGTITIDSGGHATSSGTSGSYLMMLSNNNGNNAVSISGGAGAVIVYAPYGTINITGGASLKEVTGYKVSIAGGSSVTYESGLANNSFSSGPSGSWAIQTWGESQ